MWRDAGLGYPARHEESHERGKPLLPSSNRESATGSAHRSTGWVAWALEAAAYLLIALALTSRSAVPDLARVPLGLVVSLVVVLPPVFAPKRSEALLLSRVGLGLALVLLIQLRDPIALGFLSWESPRHEVLSVSATGVLVAVMGVLVGIEWLRAGAGQGRSYAAVALVTVGLLALFVAVTWPLLNRVMMATTEPEGRFYGESLGALSIILQYGVLMAYALLVSPLGRHRRLAIVAALALLIRLHLPQTGGL